MHSRCELALLIALAGCGDDRDPGCEQSYLTYQTFGEPFMADYCNGCHSSSLPADMRQQAPTDVNFDTLDEIRMQHDVILTTTVSGSSMPPAGGPSDAERQMLQRWLYCGAP